MYFPYLRGKQYELLALKELAQDLDISSTTKPLIEPVRRPQGSGLGRCVEVLQDRRVDFSLIVNPSVGHLAVQSTVSPEIAEFVLAAGERASNWDLALLIDEATDLEGLLESYRTQFQGQRVTLVHRSKHEHIDELVGLTSDLNRQTDVIGGGMRRRHFRDLLQSSKAVTLTDQFTGQDRNSDFVGIPPSSFTEEHLYLDEENWFGFGDFLTIGDRYTDGGFTPRAVAIHWTFPRADDSIWLGHFVSDSNEDTSNVGRKFLEALDKLIAFMDETDIQTRAAEVMRDHHRASTFPGLGIIKKLSLQNHLEVVHNVTHRAR